MVHRQVSYQRPHKGGFGMPDLESYWITEILTVLSRSLTTDVVYRRKVERAFPQLKSNPEDEDRSSPRSEALYLFLSPVTFLGLEGAA